jgi:glycosyltransferase involved in cell wall biosynthesis
MMDSILNQTYPAIELICINDGSTDNTEKRIKEYMPLFEQAGKQLLYVDKPHKGQAAAVNAGLKIMRGDYFGLLDSDDYLTPDSIAKKVDVLEKSTEYAIVSSDFYMVDEKDLKREMGIGNAYIGDLCYQPNQFYLLLTGCSSVTPLSYLIRTSDFCRINPGRKIHECKEGQNYQLLLPLYYYYKRAYIDEPLGYYVVREESHDHKKRSQEEMSERYTDLLQMLKEVLESLPMQPEEVKKCMRLSVFNKHLEDI